MKTQNPSNYRNLRSLVLVLAAALAAVSSARAQNSAFTYQGRLDAAGQPAHGTFDLRLALYANPGSGGPIAGTTITNANVLVSNGLFTTTVDFGASAGLGAFDGGARYLEIGVRSNSVGGTFAILSPRQRVTATPYAIRADYFGGDIADGQLSPNIARLTGNQSFTGTMFLTNRLNMFAGTGTGLTNLDASNFSQGTLPNARLSPDVARRSTGQSFTGINTFSNTVRIADNDVLEFGAGLAKETSAGKIGYGAFTPNTLDIVGAGTNVASRAIRFFAERDAQFTGPIRMQSDDAVFLRGNTDNNHGIAYCGTSTRFATVSLDGPVVFGYDGGGLGVRRGTNESLVMSWNYSGNVTMNGELTAVAINLTSDRNAKEKFKPVNAREVLEKVAGLPISEWQYKTQKDRHIGPMAQDFRAAFAVGHDERHIATVDADGVALAAIKGLHELMQEREQEVSRLRSANEALAERLAAIEQMVRHLTNPAATENR